MISKTCTILQLLTIVITVEGVIKKPTVNVNSNSQTSGSSSTYGGSGYVGSISHCGPNITDVTCNPRTILYAALFDNVNAKSRPYCGENDVINATLDVAIRQLNELDEPQQVLKLNSWIRLSWYDCQFVWNVSDFGNIDNIKVPFETIWVPDVTIYDSTSETFYGYREFRPQVFSDGKITYNFPTIIESQCLVDVRYFPFDTQKCVLKFGSWVYHGQELDFEPKYDIGDLSSAQINAEWELKSFTAKRHVTVYNCCHERYPDIRFTLEIKRKPLYYMINILIPTFLITIDAVLVFILPVESGEKIGFSITIMLALSVFQILISDSMPPSAETVPLIAIYFDFMLFLCLFATVVAVIAIYVYYRDDKPMSPRVKRIILQPLAKLSFVKLPVSSWKNQDNEKFVSNNNSSEPELLQISKTLEFNDNGCITLTDIKLEADDNHNTDPEDWKLLSVVIDRIGCAVFSFLFILCTSVIIILYNS